MAQSFSFGFNSEDFSDEEHSNSASGDVISKSDGLNLVEPCLHTLDEMLGLPSSISFTTRDIVLATARHETFRLPRRELFDIRAQIMAEEGAAELAAGVSPWLSLDDIQPRIYEGGFKTWECSVDLAKYLAQKFIDENALYRPAINIFELGAGTALPTAIFLHHVLSRSNTGSAQTINLVVTDYNSNVLMLSTIPNLLLVWASLQPRFQPWSETGELEISQDLLIEFKNSLSDKGMTIHGISGAWGQPFVGVVRSINGSWSEGNAEKYAGSAGTNEHLNLILASETIYSPASLRNFASTTLSLLSSLPAGQNMAFIAAKRMYFGVGGGVDEFLNILDEMGASATEVWTSGKETGVERCILQVSLR